MVIDTATAPNDTAGTATSTATSKINRIERDILSAPTM
jgi:hypothetical protein